MKTTMLTVNECIGEYLDATGHEGELDEIYLKKCLSDGASRLHTFQQYKHMVEVFDVYDYKFKLPLNFKYIIQAACRVEPPLPIAREAISKMTQKVLGTGCEIQIDVKCPACHSEPCACDDRKVVEVDVNRIWETANPQYFTRYMQHYYMHGGNTGRGYRSLYHDDFILMKKSSGSFWNIPYHINGCLNLRVESGYEYNVEPPNMIVNFKEGEVLVGYIAEQTDAEGYLLIPETPQAIQAVIWYAAERMAFLKYSQAPSQATERFWKNMYQMREIHIGRAKNELRMYSEDEFLQFVDNYWRKAVPYRNFMRNLNRNAPDAFMLPDQTLNIEGYTSPYYKNYRR